MATQAIEHPQPQVIAAEGLQRIFSICDKVAEDLGNDSQIRAVPVASVLPLGNEFVELLKSRLKAITNIRFEIDEDAAGDIALFPVVESMSFESPPSSFDSGVGVMLDDNITAASPPDTNNGASAHSKKNMEKTPRPKNAFMIYRLDLHATVAAQNPGMHNNDISKIIGARWRAEEPHVVQEYKRRAEEEKRQHAIDHPGYRYQPRKPSEKKKRMTKNKLAKLAAKSGRGNAAMNVGSVPGQVMANDQLYNMLAGEQLNFNSNALPHEITAPQLAAFNGVDLDIGAIDDSWASLNVQYEQPQPEAGMIALQDSIDMTAGFSLPSREMQISSPTTAPEPFVEQRRHEQLDDVFTMDDLVHFPLGDAFAAIEDDFNAAENAVFWESED